MSILSEITKDSERKKALKQFFDFQALDYDRRSKAELRNGHIDEAARFTWIAEAFENAMTELERFANKQ